MIKVALVAVAALLTLWLAVGLSGCSLFGASSGGSGEGDRLRTESVER